MLFCSIGIDPDNPLTNPELVSSIRCQIASLLDIDSAQKALAEYWKPCLDNLHVNMADTTWYESSIRYPTGVKLLWEEIDQLHRHMCKIRKYLRIRRLRNKYLEVKQAYLIHSKKRNRKANATRMLTRRLLELLEKLLRQMQQLIASHGPNIKLSGDFLRRLKVITRVLEQQNLSFKDIRSKVALSVSTNTISALSSVVKKKRGRVGTKVNTIQVDALSFIQHISFDAFNEGTQLKNCVPLHHKLLRVSVVWLPMPSMLPMPTVSSLVVVRL